MGSTKVGGWAGSPSSRAQPSPADPGHPWVTLAHAWLQHQPRPQSPALSGVPGGGGWVGAVSGTPPTPMEAPAGTHPARLVYSSLDEPLLVPDNSVCLKGNSEGVEAHLYAREQQDTPRAPAGTGRLRRGASECPRDGARRMLHVAGERCSLRAEPGWGRCNERSPPFAPQFSHSPKEHRCVGKPSAARAGSGGGGCVSASGRVGAPPLPLFPSDPPLASDFFLCGSSRACQKNALAGARERAGRAARCVRACVLPLTSLNRAGPELQRRGSL